MNVPGNKKAAKTTCTINTLFENNGVIYFYSITKKKKCCSGLETWMCGLNINPCEVG